MKIATIASLVASTLATASFFPSKAEADARICNSGLSWHPIEKGDKQAKVTAVDTGSSAQTVGFRPGDIILTIADKPFAAEGNWDNSLTRALQTCKPFDVTVRHPGQAGEPVTLHFSYTAATPPRATAPR